ncbi:MAG: glycosyltransferase, partial [Actinomycetota bacterium]|nr:glycosyltransferase [Actinomycetota bacterium]
MNVGFDILLTSRTGFPIVELTRAFASALSETGHDARILEDRIPPVRNDRVMLVIGPHDVLPHLATPDSAGLTASLARGILVCCERPHTPDWATTVGYARKAGSLLHVSDMGVSAFAELGLPAQRFRLGYHESLDRWRGVNSVRPIDVVFFGLATPRRTELLAKSGDVFADYDVDLRLTDGAASRSRHILGFVSEVEKRDLLAQAKVVLNLHPAGDRSFEWVRAIDAISSGCVLVSEEYLGVAPLEPGRHVLTGTPASLPLLIDVLLRDPARLDEIRNEAYGFIRAELPLVRSVQLLVDLSTQLPRRPPPGRNFAVSESGASEAASSRESPTHATESELEGRLSSDSLLLLARQNAVLKKLFFDVRLLRRQVAHIAHTIDDPSSPLLQVTSTPVANDAQVDVSVVVTVHNYARFVAEALLSVVSAEGVDLEVIVVDDASIDDSPAIVRGFMEEHPNFPITLYEQRINTGVQRARNLAFSHARAPFAFVLDADNLVYPRGIAKLRDALARDSQAAFSYGLIERFDEGGAVGLMGTEPWDPALLAQRNYIDAMALIRVDVWKQVGGYVTDPLLELGWEDYDLWLSFAVAGFHGVHVREIIGRYRVHGVSSLTMTTLDTSDLMEKLRHR